VIETWSVKKAAVHSPRGIVAAQHYLAAAAGAELLAAGGNAVDAAVATAFALGVVEPWMSGIGGGGILLFGEAGGKVSAVDFMMTSSRHVDPSIYKLTGRQAPGLFNWPEVEENRNLQGWHSMLVPGSVDGLGLALERFGRKSLAEVIAPALRLAEAGMPVDWHSTLAIAVSAPDLARYPSSRELYLPGGLPAASAEGAPKRLDMSALASTYRRLAEAGRRDFYEGALARDLVADLAAGGSAIAADDLAAYRAEIVDALEFDYRGVRVSASPGLTGGVSLKEIMAELDERIPSMPRSAPDGHAYHVYASAARRAFDRRLNELGRATGGNTTHLSVVDRDGNFVALTNTLLSRFGSKVVLPRTGVTMNNGIMWFDPVPGKPNSIAASTKPLANMCPALLSRDGKPFAALGACGGRRIIPAVSQLISFLVDYGMTLERAFATPRVDASTETILVDPRLGEDVIEHLRAELPIAVEADAVFPTRYAVPSAVMREGPGQNSGAAYVQSPVAAAVAEAPG
jgi:gamma-glutamyltranspeptidase/glutathione hydrolase